MKLARAALALVCSSGALVFACSSYSDSPSGPIADGGTEGSAPSSSGDMGDSGGTGANSSGDSGASTVEGQPKWCGPADAQPPPIGGTDACPSDKNLPGCPCAALDAEAACWTGLRKNRQVGVCHDGRTKCVAGAAGNVWGACSDEKLPDGNPTNDQAACTCFSTVKWKIDNIAPCIWQDANGYYAYSTWPASNATPGVEGCGLSDHLARDVQPEKAWSTSTLTTDCPGSFKVCVRLRAGDWTNPSENDCILGQSCVDAKNIKAFEATKLDDLPPWKTVDGVCAKAYETAPDTQTPGYAELTVTGKTTTCNAVASEASDKEHLFKRIPICARICRPGSPGYDPSNADCIKCQAASAE